MSARIRWARVHPAQGSQPHRGVGQASEWRFRHQLAACEHEGFLPCGDREGVFEDGVGEIHRGVAQTHLGR